MSTISVVVPVYKVEKYINRCIESISKQVFSDFDLILIDDGSEDECGQICDNYALTDNRIVIIHKYNGGLSDARNTGIEYAINCSDSEWISFIDSDDWVHPYYLELLFEAVQSTDLCISVCGFQREEKMCIETINRLNLNVCSTVQLFCDNRTNAIVAWGKLFRKCDYFEIRFPFGRIHEDEFTTYKLLFKYSEVAYINEPLYYYYFNRNGIMQRTQCKKYHDKEDAFKQQLDFFNKNGFDLLSKATVFFLCDYYIALLQNQDIPKDEKKKIAKRTKRLVRRYHIRNYLPFHNNYTYYNFAYPRLMYLYWFIRGIINRLH